MQNNYQKWQLFAPLGLLLTGMGTSIAGEAATRKAAGKRWFGLGTLGLCLLNAGIAFFGEAVKVRLLYEQEG